MALWIKRGGMEKADVFSAPTASGRQRMDRMAAEWISGQILYEHVIIARLLILLPLSDHITLSICDTHTAE